MLERLSTRGRILLLVIGSAVPSIALSIYVALDQRALSYTFAGITALAILLVLLAWHGAQRLVLAPIRVMLETMRRVRAGDLTARTGLKASREELSQLGAALDAMAEQLQTHDRELKQALENLTQQAMTDALTGLYNRRFFWDALTREIAAAKRKGVLFSVILLDIDRFKLVNDTCGHDAGDVVLKEIADVLQKSVRGSDTAVRHGGEEFAILLPDTSIEVAAERAESLRRQLENHEIGYGDQRIGITASFGVAQYGPFTADPAALMKAVDAAMYAAKAAGRNRVVVSELFGCDAQPQPLQPEAVGTNAPAR